MNRTITLQTAAFGRLISEIAYKPDPNDPDDDGPGPWNSIAGPLDRYGGPYPIPWRNRTGDPRPVPWIAARKVREQIARVQDHYELISLMADKTSGSRPAEAIGERLLVWVDELCPRMIKISIPPRPRPWREMADILVAAAELQNAAQQTGPLQAQFQVAADRLFDNAAARLEIASKTLLQQNAST